jgi:hypothetical protein
MISLTNTAYSLLLALAGRVPAGTTPGLNRLLAEQDPGSTTRGVATFRAVPTAEQVCALEELGLAVQPMQYVAMANVAGPVGAMQAAVAEGIATDVYLDELAPARKPVRAAHRFTRETRIESPRDAVVLAMVR